MPGVDSSVPIPDASRWRRSPQSRPPRGLPINADPTRAYFGTDTHAMSVLVGAALAAVWCVAGFRRVLAPGARALIIAAGVLGLAASGALLMWATEYSPWLYRGASSSQR